MTRVSMSDLVNVTYAWAGQSRPLIPILTSTGRGSDIMVPMAIPSFGGMIIAMLTVFVVPVLYCWVEEGRVKVL